jgi:hypothetical protein
MISDLITIADDAVDACAEVERTGTPGSVIREMNDELVDLRARMAERDALIQKAAAHVRPTCHDLYAELMQALSASAEPSAPAEQDERADFEAWHASVWPEGGIMVGRWMAWQARASLEIKP